MWELTFRNLLAKKARVLSMAISILAAVAFLVGSLVLVDTLASTFDDLFQQLNAETDAVVRSSTVVDSPDANELRATIDEALVDDVAGVPGVAAVSADVFGYAQLIDKDGEAMGNPGMGAPTLGLSWATSEELNIVNLVAGAPPAGPTDVVIDKRSADLAGFEVGDPITILVRSGPEEFVVAGIAKFGDEDSAVGSSMALFELATAQAMVGEPGRIDSITVKAADDVSQEELVERIGEVVPAGVEVITGETLTDENNEQVADALGFFNTFVVVFAAIAVFVAAFIIYNTFSILVVQRTKELALLRALGAARRQIVAAVLAEAVLVGVLATALGVVGGLFVAQGLRALIRFAGIPIPTGGVVLTVASVVTAVVVGVGVTVAAALIPSRRASKIAPMAAIREAALPTASTGVPRIAFGAVTLVAGLPMLLVGLFADLSSRLLLIGIGGAATFIGVTALSPLAARPFARVFGLPIAKLRGVPGELAQENAMRNPKRTATTASALMIGVGLVGAISIFAASAKTAIDGIVDKALVGDFVIDSGTFGFGGLDPAIAERLTGLPEIDAASGVRLGYGEIDGAVQTVFAIDPATIERLADVGVAAGRIAELGVDDIAVYDEWAAGRGLELGDTLRVLFPETGEREMTVAVLFADDDLTGNLFMSQAAHELSFRDSLDFQIYVARSADSTPESARAAIESVLGAYPNAELQDVEEYKDSIRAQIDQLLGLVYALLGLAVLIALIGIANTLALTTLERTHELGLLRAVGMTRRQVRSAVRGESLLISAFGAVLGLAVGVFFGWVIVASLADQGFTTLAIPYLQLAVVAVIAIVAGLVAATRPAWRTAKLDILTAVSAE